MKITFTFLMLLIVAITHAQDTVTYKSYRSVWSISPRFGVGDKQTRADFTTYGGIGLRREFALFKLLSLNATASYSSVYGRYGNPNLNVLAAGAGLTVYPFYIVDKIYKKIFPNYRTNPRDLENYYFDVTAEFNLNKTRYGSAGDVSGPRFEANLGRSQLNKTLFLSPKFGLHGFIFPNRLAGSNLEQSLFFYAGAAIGLSPKPKNR